MKITSRTRCAVMAIALPLMAACSDGNDTVATQSKAPAVTSMSKPTAPVDMSYEIVGRPVVGRPILINVKVSSTAGPVDVSYSITDNSAVSFQQGQVEHLRLVEPSQSAMQQLSVVPLREGRVFVNVSAEVQTANGIKIRSMAIPIKVGSAPQEAVVNGELKEGPDGETVISMPAEPSKTP